MVNFVNVGSCTAYPLPKDWSKDSERKFRNIAPIYAPADVKKLLGKKALGTRLFTKNSILDAANEGLSLVDVGVLIGEALDHGRYKGAEWCKPSDLERVLEGNVPVAACDAYSVRRQDSKRVLRNFYVKFAIAVSGNLILIFSCHP